MAKKISELTAASALTGSELVEVVQVGASRKATLGTAAGKAAQTSKTDTTADALMVVGAGGLLDTVSPAVTDLDAQTRTQFLREAGATGSPAGGASTVGMHIGGATTDLALQLVGRVSGDRLWWRRKNTTWAAWMEIFHSAAACLLNVDTASFGFSAGAGGTATQNTDKSTGVTLNKPSGQITMNAASLAANTAVSFTLTNNKITSNDLVDVEIKSGAATGGSYLVQCDQKATGSCRISVRNLTGGALAEALVLQFEVRKGAIA